MLGALIAGIFISSLSLVGAFFFGKDEKSAETHHGILPFAVGVFLGVVFFELIPETLEASASFGAIAILIGYLGFYLLSHILDTYHHHHFDEHDSCVQSGARMLLIGDSIHNLADGIVIASAFLINPTVGMLTAVGIALHEVPQEIAEFGVLIKAGYTRSRALFYNFLSASSILVGIVITYLFAESLGNYVYILTGIAAGNLLYIATDDLIPELRESHRDHFLQTFLIALVGLLSIGGLIALSHSLEKRLDAENVTTTGYFETTAHLS